MKTEQTIKKCKDKNGLDKSSHTGYYFSNGYQ